MENNETLKEEVSDYIETKIKLIKLKTIDKTGTALSGIITLFVMAILSLFILLFLSMAAAYTVAELSGKNSLGFLTVAGFYILLCTFIFIFKEKIITMPVINILLKKYYYVANSK